MGDSEFQERIRALEAEVAQKESDLEEMTAALSQAWDQLVMLTQEAPDEATSTQDIVPILEAAMSAADAAIGAVCLLPEDGPPEWFTLPDDTVARHALQNRFSHLPEDDRPAQADGIPMWNGRPSRWLLAPMKVGGEVVGALGVGVEAARKFNAYDVRMLARMAERAAGQIGAATLIESQEREARIARDLRVAGMIQRSIQPTSPPFVPGMEIAAHWQPASSVGGDAWGWVVQPSGRLAVFMLDVAGKGLPAALAAVSLHTAIKMMLRLDLSPEQALHRVNDEFYQPYTDAGLLATASVIALDPIRRTLNQANAGHTPTLLRMGGSWQHWPATVPPIGVLPALDFEPQRAALQTGDIAICYSDGLSEITVNGGLWGYVGIMEVVPPHVEIADEIVRVVLAAADSIREGPPHDDQTLFVLHMEDAL